jgi:hypothetical protein
MLGELQQLGYVREVRASSKAAGCRAAASGCDIAMLSKLQQLGYVREPGRSGVDGSYR